MARAENRGLEGRVAAAVRGRLRRDERTGVPPLEALSPEDQHLLCEVGGGRLGVVAITVLSAGGAAPVAGLVGAEVRRADLVVSSGEDTLLVLAPGLDPVAGEALADRLSSALAAECVALVGVVTRSAASRTGWTVVSLANEAVRASQGQPSPA